MTWAGKVNLGYILNRMISFLFNGINFLTGINTFHATKLFLYPLKTRENSRFSGVFRGF